jgi:rhodanese-related sulfurtransferase
MSKKMNGAPGINRLLAIAAVLLAVVSLVGSADPGNSVTLDLNELALIVENEVDHVTVQDLADRIITGSTEYRLLDLRDADSYAKYHIPGAENVPLTGLPDYPVLRNEKIILYSGGGIHSAQAWFLLKAKGYPAAYMLLGGLNSWEDEILFPELAENAAPEAVAEFAKTQEVSRYFGGSPRIVGQAAQDGMERVMPMVVTPTAPVITTKKRAAREGC